MKIHIVGTRGWSYAGMEDLVRELGPRFVREGHEVTIHAWATEETIAKNISSDEQQGVRRQFHRTTNGKFTGQFYVAIKSAWAAARSDCDVIYCAFIQNGIHMWLPRLFGKRILSNVDGIMWKDPKWPRGFRHIFFPGGAYLTYLFSQKTITDSYHMQQLYRKAFGLDLGWVGYGCSPDPTPRKVIDLTKEFPEGYYLVMSRMTPHNLTDVIVDGFVASNSSRPLLLAGHVPGSDWFRQLQARAYGKKVRFLGLVRDQEYLTQVILNAKAYLHGHSLGGINPALVRVAGLGVPVICIDTVFNREVVQTSSGELQAICFARRPDSVAAGIAEFEHRESHYTRLGERLGERIRKEMSWDTIYRQYRDLIMSIAPKA